MDPRYRPEILLPLGAKKPLMSVRIDADTKQSHRQLVLNPKLVHRLLSELGVHT